MANLKGAILIGGKSRRMGQDKASMQMHGQESQAKRTLDLMAKHCVSVSLSCAETSIIPDDVQDVAVILDQYGDVGPCGAILSILESDPNSDWLILACDYPLLDQTTISQLVSESSNTKQAISYASRIDQRPEPLCAIYRSEHINALKQWIAADKRCARHFLESLEPHLLTLKKMHALENANTPEELEEILHKQEGNLSSVTIKTLYFANLRDLAGTQEENLTTQAKTAAGLYDELRVKYDFPANPKHLRVAINEEFVDWTHPLSEKDEVVFIPPVAGG